MKESEPWRITDNELELHKTKVLYSLNSYVKCCQFPTHTLLAFVDIINKLILVILFHSSIDAFMNNSWKAASL